MNTDKPDISSYMPMLDSFARSLRARNRSANTVRIYLGCGMALASWCVENEGITEWGDITRRHIEEWLAERLTQFTPGDAKNKFGSVQQIFKWLAAEDEIDRDPMAGMEPPHVPEKLVVILTEDQIRRLFKTCDARDFTSRRDMAILRLFVATGMRLAEMAGIKLDDLDLDPREVVITGKGDKPRRVRFDHGTALAIDRYLRVRGRQKWHHRPEMWLGEANRGTLGREGIYQLVKRRASEADMPEIYPHVFRHTYAHRWLNAGGAEQDLVQQAGWNSPQMLRRYGASAKAERARTAYDRLDIMGGL